MTTCRKKCAKMRRTHFFCSYTRGPFGSLLGTRKKSWSKKCVDHHLYPPGDKVENLLGDKVEKKYVLRNYPTLLSNLLVRTKPILVSVVTWPNLIVKTRRHSNSDSAFVSADMQILVPLYVSGQADINTCKPINMYIQTDFMKNALRGQSHQGVEPTLTHTKKRPKNPFNGFLGLFLV